MFLGTCPPIRLVSDSILVMGEISIRSFSYDHERCRRSVAYSWSRISLNKFIGHLIESRRRERTWRMKMKKEGLTSNSKQLHPDAGDGDDITSSTYPPPSLAAGWLSSSSSAAAAACVWICGGLRSCYMTRKDNNGAPSSLLGKGMFRLVNVGR